MEIALIYEKFVSRGGMESYVWRLARELKAAGHSLKIVTSKTDEVTRLFDAPLVELPWRGRGGARLRAFAEDAAEWVREHKPERSVGFLRTFLHDAHRAGGGCHRVYSRDLPFWKRWSPKNRTELALERRLYTGGGTRLFVVNSTMVAGQLSAEYAVPGDRLRVIHTPVDQETFAPSTDRDGERAALGLAPEDRVFLFVSRNHSRKGLGALLDVWKDVPGTLWIAGPRLKGRFRSQARALGGKVVELGEIDDLPLRYRVADWFVHPTKYDAAANTVFQALASGLPGLISERDGAAEFVEHGVNGWRLTDPEDREELRAGLLRMAAVGGEERARMGQAARASIEGLTWERHVQEWREALEGL